MIEFDGHFTIDPAWMRRRYLMIHCSDTEDGDGYDAAAIRRFHVEHRKFVDVGYHFLVERAGGELRAVFGRSFFLPGAACREQGMNRHAVHVCVVGKFDKHAPDDELIEFLARRVCAPMIETFDITPMRIVPHREFTPYKTCPGKMFKIEPLREAVRKIGDYL